MPIDVLSVESLNFYYNSTEVLSGISLVIHQGDYIGLVGPNGSGKTTLIKVLLGLLPFNHGRISLFGQDIVSFKEWNRIGYLPQKAASINPRFPATVMEIAAMGLLASKTFPRYIRHRDREIIEDTLKSLGILDLKNRLIGELSGGQQQRVLLAKAIVGNPDFLILDEPTSALDPHTRERFFDLLREMNEQRRITIILVTHDIANIGRYSSKLLYLDKTIIFYGSFLDFCESSDVTRLFGSFAQHIICHRHDHNNRKTG